MKKSVVVLLEPIMFLEVVVADEYSTVIMADLSKRRAEILSIDMRGQNKVTNIFFKLNCQVCKF